MPGLRVGSGPRVPVVRWGGCPWPQSMLSTGAVARVKFWVAKRLLTQSALSSAFDGTQDQRRDLLGAVGRAGHAHGFTAPHLALDGPDGAIGRHHPLIARGIADQDFAAWRNAHYRGQEPVLTNGHKTHAAILDDPEDRIGRAEINPNDLPLLTHHGPPGAQWSPAAGRRGPAPRRLRHSATPAGAGDSPGAARG